MKPQLKILVAEDDSISLKFISKIKNIWRKPINCGNGFEAVSLCKKHPDIDIIWTFKCP
jgi:CheY-like chemotaxis protein